MEYRALGRSGLKVSVLTVGTMTFGGRGGFANQAKTASDRLSAADLTLLGPHLQGGAPQ